MSSDPQDRPKIDLPLAPPQPLELPTVSASDPVTHDPAENNLDLGADNNPGDDLGATGEPPSAMAESVEEAEPTQPDPNPELVALQAEIAALRQEKEALLGAIADLQAEKDALFNEQTGDLQAQIQDFMAQSLQTLQDQQAQLQQSVAKLERRRDRIREEMRTTFAGTSQEIAVRVQGFRDYLMGSLQDLVMAAEQLDFPTYNNDNWSQSPPPPPEPPAPQKLEPPQFAKQNYAARMRHIEELLDQYRMSPDYYGPPWQLRRTFEPIHAERVKNWFFQQGGRGAVKSMGSRLQNILVASASLSVLYSMYGDRLRALILANTPERLGEWRRGLQDCLGISRGDFGPNSGVILFESPEALVQKADRLVEDDRLPLIIIDEAEDSISLSLLQYSLLLAFAPEPQTESSYFF